jgi:hypothetical protein
MEDGQYEVVGDDEGEKKMKRKKKKKKKKRKEWATCSFYM